jgi:hypothetical protein
MSGAWKWMHESLWQWKANAAEAISANGEWRRGTESNRSIKVLQTFALPLGYRAMCSAAALVTSHLESVAALALTATLMRIQKQGFPPLAWPRRFW